MRFQSVLDGIFVFFPLFMICLSQGDDSDRIARSWGERHKGATVVNHANPNPSLLTVVPLCVGPDEKKALEHPFRFCEMEPMLPDVGAVLSFIPFNIYCNSKCSYIQADSQS